MNFLPVLLISVGLLGLAFAGLAIRILIIKAGKFVNIHIGSNKDMQVRGITCAQSWDKMEQKKANKALQFEGLKLSSDN